jgi:hypothetical protein
MLEKIHRTTSFKDKGLHLENIFSQLFTMTRLPQASPFPHSSQTFPINISHISKSLSFSLSPPPTPPNPFKLMDVGKSAG